MLMRGGAKLFVSHYARKYFFVGFHAVDKEFIEYALQISRKIGQVIGSGGFDNCFVAFRTGADLVEEQLIGLGEVCADALNELIADARRQFIEVIRRA